MLVTGDDLFTYVEERANINLAVMGFEEMSPQTAVRTAFVFAVGNGTDSARNRDFVVAAYMIAVKSGAFARRYSVSTTESAFKRLNTEVLREVCTCPIPEI